jgi:hypothetical protein
MRLYRDDWNSIVAARRGHASIQEALVLKELIISRHAPDVSNPAEYSLLTFHLTFKNEATVPIKFSMQTVSFLIDSVEIAHGNLNHTEYRIGAGDGMAQTQGRIFMNKNAELPTRIS